MSALLFKLRNVPEDEADDIRALLKQHHIDIYETSAGNWGISMPGIWVSDDNDLERGKALIDQYQRERAVEARQHYERARHSGEAPTLLQRVKERPLAILGIVLFCLFILYAMISPFVRLALHS